MKTKIMLSILAIGSGVLLYKYYPLLQLYWQQTEKTNNSEEQTFYVRSGISLDELEAQLIESGVLVENSAFRNLASYKNLNLEECNYNKVMSLEERMTWSNGIVSSKLIKYFMIKI